MDTNSNTNTNERTNTETLYLSRWGPAARRRPPSQSSPIPALTSSFDVEGEAASMSGGLEAKLPDRHRESLLTSVTATMITR